MGGQSTGPRVECSLFIRSLRILLGPRQLELLVDLFKAIGEASTQQAAGAAAAAASNFPGVVKFLFFVYTPRLCF